MVKRMPEILAGARELYEAMYRFDAAAARALGLHISDLRCVNALESGPLSAGEIGRRLALTSGAVTAMLDRLEAATVVERRRDPEDRRRVDISLRPDFYRRAAGIYDCLGRAMRKKFVHAGASEMERSAETVLALSAAFDAAALAVEQT